MSARAKFIINFRPDCFPNVALLDLADKAGRIGRSDGLFLQDLVSLFQLAGDFVGVDAKGEVQRVGKDVVIESEFAVEDVLAAAPTVFDVLRNAQFTGSKRMFRQLIEQGLIRRIR